MYGAEHVKECGQSTAGIRRTIDEWSKDSCDRMQMPIIAESWKEKKVNKFVVKRTHDTVRVYVRQL